MVKAGLPLRSGAGQAVSRTDGRLANWYFLRRLHAQRDGLRLACHDRRVRLRLRRDPDRAGDDLLVPGATGVSRGLVLSVSMIGGWYAGHHRGRRAIFGDTGGARLVTNIMDMIGSCLHRGGAGHARAPPPQPERRPRSSAMRSSSASAAGSSGGSALVQPTLAISTEPLASSLIEGLYQPTGSVILFLMAVLPVHRDRPATPRRSTSASPCCRCCSAT